MLLAVSIKQFWPKNQANGVIKYDYLFVVKVCLLKSEQKIFRIENMVFENNEPIIVTFPDVSFRELTYFEEELEMRKYIRDNPN